MKKKTIIMGILCMFLMSIVGQGFAIDEPTEALPKDFILTDSIKNFFLQFGLITFAICGSGVETGKWCKSSAGVCYQISSCYDYCSPVYDTESACIGEVWPTQSHIDKCNNLAGQCSSQKIAIITGGCEPKQGSNTLCTNCNYQDCAFDEACYISSPGVDAICIKTNGGASVCTDSDVTSKYPDGKNKFIKGTTKDATKTRTDFCGTNNQLNEYWCSDNEVVTTPLYCDSGYECKEGDGACTEEVIKQCTEDDGGKDYYKKGTTRIDNNVIGIDECIGTSTVFEYYCIDGSYGTTSYNCLLKEGKECQDGKCFTITPECTTGATDCKDIYDYLVCENKEWVNKGKTIGKCGVECSSDSDCESDEKCSSSFKCQEIQPILSCSDTDGGKDRTKQGTVTTDSSQGCEDGCTDYCSTIHTDPYKVIEFWCESSTKKGTAIFIDCSSGEICKGGVCVASDCTDTTWSPDTSTVCLGEVFTQTSDCENTRERGGSKDCDGVPPVTPPTIPPTCIKYDTKIIELEATISENPIYVCEDAKCVLTKKSTSGGLGFTNVLSFDEDKIKDSDIPFTFNQNEWIICASLSGKCFLSIDFYNCEGVEPKKGEGIDVCSLTDWMSSIIGEENVKSCGARLVILIAIFLFIYAILTRSGGRK